MYYGSGTVVHNLHQANDVTRARRDSGQPADAAVQQRPSDGRLDCHVDSMTYCIAKKY